MKRKRKHKLTHEQATRLLILADHMKTLKSMQDFPAYRLFEDTIPYSLIDGKMVFTCYPVIYSELGKLFPNE